MKREARSQRVLNILTIGHSNRTIQEFIDLLKTHNVNLLVDVRRFPFSKWEWFRKDSLSRSLQEIGIEYLHLGGELGGFRKGGYIQYMNTREFREGADKLLQLAKKHKVAIMCAEKIPFRCHRRFISGYLQRKEARVIHIIDVGRSYEVKRLKNKR